MHGRDRQKYVILGAGISGLTLAWFLKKNDPECDLLILEKSSKTGGWIQTHNTFGFLFEMGPHTLRLSPPYHSACNELFDDLDLTSKLITPDQAFRSRFLAYDNKLHPLDLNPINLLNPKCFIKLTYPILKNLIKPCQLPTEDSSIKNFFEVNFGEYITKHFVDPLVMGIKGGHIEDLSFKSCFPTVHKMAQSSKPILLELLKHKKKSKAGYISFKEGLGTLTNALHKKLQDSIELKTEVLGIDNGKRPCIITTNGKIECDHIFSTLPSNALAKILESHQLNTQSFLKEQKHISYKIVHLGYNAKLDLPNAFGFVSPSWSRQKISGVIFDSKIFPQQDFHAHQTRLTAMIHQDSPLFDLSKQGFEKSFFDELNALLKIHVNPQYFEVFELNNAIPQYDIGHSESVHQFNEELKAKLPYLSFCGSSFHGLSVPMCINYAKKIASLLPKKMHESFSR
ncbi:MAG: Protoporphyrinogen oxidase [Chlamydiae bacterium]|nr:Protoporphyrinogen oxidase [Chlamydiota bacterium]